MTFRGARIWFSALWILSLGAVACGGGAGRSDGSNGYAAAGDCTSGDTHQGELDSKDHPSILVGHFVGHMAGETDYDVEFFADGTCAWSWDWYYDDQGPELRTGWAWTVFGAAELPDFGSPWMLRLSPVSTDTTSTAETYRIVTVAEDGFTVYDDIEGNDIFMEMKRVP